ncbi:phage tail protein [uncultured Streptococcus sp.]|uniref:phage tail protein n=1 Tax=uncultured Streptococcus sp. TaxID=83427 RepID=UPI0028E57B09|nr:phage tail protein [uncultured Streptococcus sp.]
MSFDAVHQFFYDFDHSNCYQVFNGSNRFEVYIEAIFKNSGYRYVIEAEAKAIRKENFGNAKRLSMFKDVIKAAGLEFSVTGKVVRIVKKVGTDLSTVVRKNFNMNELALEKNIGGFITYKKGFGAWKDENNHDAGRYETEYESPLARVYGRIEGEPISDERYKETGKLLERIKHDVDNSYSISVQLEMEDLTRAGYKYTQPRAGDYIMAINETIGFREKIRIVSYESSYDVTGRLINHKVTCNDIGTVQKAISSEGSIMRSVSQSKEYAESALAIATRALVSADGKNTIYYGAEKPRDQPRGTLHSGDLLYLTVGEETELYFWNGSEWELKILKFDSSKLEKMFADSKASTDQAIAEANKRAEEALKKAGTLPDTTKLSDQIKQQILASQDLTQKITETLNQTDSGVVYNKVLQNIKNDFVEQKDINPVLAGLNQKIATQTIEFQKLTESNKLYERIIGTSETDAPDKLSRLVMSSEIFQTEVGKYAKDDFNLVYDPTNFSKWKKKQPEANVVEVPASTKLLRITNSGNANNVYRGFALPLTTSTFTKDEKISYRLEAWVDVLPDKPLGIELWNDNSVIASDRVTFTKTGRQVITGTMTVNKTTNESRDYPLEFWLLKNGTVAIGKVSLIRGDRPPNKFMDNTSTQDIATQTKVTQLDGSYSIRNLRSAGDVLGQINLNPDGSVRINEGLLSVGEKTIIKDGVIKKSMIGKAQIGTAHIDEIDASKANLINVTAKNVATEGLTANIIKGGKLSSLNGVTDFDLQTGWLEMNKEQVGIRNKFDGKPMQFLVFGQGAINGVPCAYTQLMSNRNGTTGIEHTSAGIQIWNGRQGNNVQTAITFYGRIMDFSPSSVAGGVTLNTETKEFYGLNKITTGDIYLSDYANHNLKALFNDIYENIRKLHAVKESRVNYSYKMLGPIQ